MKLKLNFFVSLPMIRSRMRLVYFVKVQRTMEFVLKIILEEKK